MTSSRSVWIVFLFLALANFSCLAAGVKLAQQYALEKGWNAVYVTVSPDETADEIFGAWPVDKVAAYDPAAFLYTKQYSGEGSTEGTSRSGYLMWRRGEPALSQVKSVVANHVYVCFATNDWTGTLYGRPVAPRNTWHPSSTNEPMNLIGFSLSEKTALADYVDGLDVGNVTFSYVLGGGNPDHFALGSASGVTEFKNGGVVVMTASKVSDWSGVLNVSPMTGIDFSTNSTYQVLTVRNDGAKARTVSVSLGAGMAEVAGNLPPVPTGLMLCDASVYTNAWRTFTPSLPFAKTLGAGESLELMLAVDRTKLLGAAGTYYGGLLTIKDEDGGSHMRATVPIEVTSDGGAASEFAWPKGLWLTSAALDTVTYFDSGESREVAAGGTMNVRLLLSVEGDGQMTLLQRVVFGSDTNGATHVYSPKVEKSFPVAIGNVKRLSSAVLPIDQPIIGTLMTTNAYNVVVTNVVKDVTNVVVETKIDSIVTNGVFASYAIFAFTVSEKSRANPYLHTFHPSHDGLQWDFKTATPSGDVFRNYVSTVKPEVFSIGNRITFDWDESSGTAWNPDETLKGDLTWELTGLRHQVGSEESATIRMKGRFGMKRISAVTMDR